MINPFYFTKRKINTAFKSHLYNFTQDEDDQLSHEIKFDNNLNIGNKNSTISDIDKIDISSHLEQQYQNQLTKDGGSRFDKNFSRTNYFYKTIELIGSSYV